MEPAVRGPRTKSGITTGRALNDALLASETPKNSRQPTGTGRQTPAAGNGIFGCRDRRPKISLRNRKGPRRPKEGNDTGENPHRNGPSRVGAGIRGFVGLDGGDSLVRTANSPPSHRTGLRFQGQERHDDRCLSTRGFYIVGSHLIPVIVAEMSPQIIHDGSNLLVAHHRSEWWHSALSVNDNFDWISAGFEISVSRK